MEHRETCLAAAVVAILAAGAVAASCTGRADPSPPEAPRVAPGARVQVVAKRLGPGWHAGLVGTVGDCVVVMIGEPPDAPVRIHPVEFAEISQLRVSDRYDGMGDPPRSWLPGADTAGERWTQVDTDALRAGYPACGF